MIYVLFEGGSQSGGKYTSEVLFWARHLVPSGSRLIPCCGNLAFVNELTRLSSELQDEDKIFIVFDRVNTLKYSEHRDGIVRNADGLRVLNAIKRKCAQLKGTYYLCKEWSFEYMCLRTGIPREVGQLRIELATTRAAVKPVELLGSHMLSLKSICRDNITVRQRNRLLLQISGLTSGSPEKALSQLLCLATGNTEFSITKDKLGPCWREDCSTIPRCLCKFLRGSTCLCSENCGNMGQVSTDGTQASKRLVLLTKLGISTFEDLFEPL